MIDYTYNGKTRGVLALARRIPYYKVLVYPSRITVGSLLFAKKTTLMAMTNKDIQIGVQRSKSIGHILFWWSRLVSANCGGRR